MTISRINTNKYNGNWSSH